jgi:hypothetical protein
MSSPSNDSWQGGRCRVHLVGELQSNLRQCQVGFEAFTSESLTSAMFPVPPIARAINPLLEPAMATSVLVPPHWPVSAQPGQPDRPTTDIPVSQD